MEKLRIPIISILLIAALAGGTVFILKQNTASYPIEIDLPEPSQEIEVYVTGSVENPGMYTLTEGDQVADAIEVAGGFTDDADTTAINLARNLRNGDRVDVYRKGESSQRININTADSWLLEALPGIGPATAKEIIDYRFQNGPFQSIEDVKKIKGIGDSTFDQLKDKITVR
ncbi:MAG: helix-hairpin-helix domain-containing protein [Dehalococcoidia bacterium]